MSPQHLRTTLALVALQVAMSAPAAGQVIIADHRAVAEFDSLPVWAVEQVKTNCDIFYGHTSHGSQIVTGMELLQGENSLFSFNQGPGTLQMTEYGDDLGHNGDMTWVPVTRQVLDQPANTFNVVMWSWCGGCSDNTEQGINIYLNAMSQLELDYPHVTFVYMMGHLDGGARRGICTPATTRSGTTARATARCSSTSPTSRAGIPKATTTPTKTTAAQRWLRGDA